MPKGKDEIQGSPVIVPRPPVVRPGDKPRDNKTPDGVLVQLKNKLLDSAGIDTVQVKRAIDAFVNNAFGGIVNSKTHFAKVNIYNEITREKMTIKVFYKLLKILGFRDVKLTVEATTARGVMVKVSHTVSMLTSEGEKDDMLESLVKSKVKKSEED